MFGQKVNGVRVFPVTIKITLIFTVIILVSNFASNYINLVLNRAQLNDLLRQLMVKDLRDLNTFANTQNEIYSFSKDLNASLKGIEDKADFELKNRKSAVLIGVKSDRQVLFQSRTARARLTEFTDAASFVKMQAGEREGYMKISLADTSLLSVYKYNQKWDAYLILAVEEQVFYEEQTKIFRWITFFIILITLGSAAVGIYVFRDILRFIGVITRSIMKMIQNQQLEVIDLGKAPNDDITYLGMAFNSLSSTVDNLITIFRKFTNRDVVQKAYRDRMVKLEGVQKELTILFSDIKSFTLITETLGMDIIKLLNLHYDKAIRKIQDHDGIVVAIIGDALLAIYGVPDDDHDDHVPLKSLQALQSAFKVQEVARELRIEMKRKKDELLERNGTLSPEDLRIYRAVLLEVGVGIDGGDVFYGTIGSNVRMTNTVIGDRVNSASRLEGLTRIYRVPVVCSEFVKRDLENNTENRDFFFVELDTVQVKGKTTGMRIYFPVPRVNLSDRLLTETERYSEGLELYYRGEWAAAYEKFKGLRFKAARVFRERTRKGQTPAEWNGIWEMKTK